MVVLPLLTCCIAATFAAEQDVSPARRALRINVPDTVELVRDVEFGKGGGRPLKLHIIRPKDAPERPMPVITFVHGGAWRAGNKNAGVLRLIPFVQKGYFSVSIEYRLTGEAVFPAQIEDCKCAIRYLRAHAKQYNIDPDRIGAWGSSAGGHLVAMLGTTGGVKDLEGSGGWPEQSSRVQAVCDWYGPADLLAMADQPSRMDHDGAASPEGRLVGGVVKQNPDNARRASPVTYVDGSDPPFLIMHGTEDMTVPYGQSEILHKALRRAGVDVSFFPVRGAGHGGPQFRSEQVGKLVGEFFAKHLGDRSGRKAEPSAGRRGKEGAASGAAEPREPRAPVTAARDAAKAPDDVGREPGEAAPVGAGLKEPVRDGRARPKAKTGAEKVEGTPRATSWPRYVIPVAVAAALAAAGAWTLRRRRMRGRVGLPS